MNIVETDTAEPQDVDPPSEQTPVPAAALTRFSPPGLPDDQWNDGWFMIPAQQGFDWTEILADSGAAEHVCSEHHFPGAPIRPASRVFLRTVAAVLGHKHGYSQKGSKRLDLTCRGDLCFLRTKMDNDHVHDCAPVMRDDEDVPVRQDGDEDGDVEEPPEDAGKDDDEGEDAVATEMRGPDEPTNAMRRTSSINVHSISSMV